MKTVSVTEFRSNIKHYLDMAENERLVIHRSKGSSFVVVPLEQHKEEHLLSPDQKTAIDKALLDIEQNRILTHESVMKQTKQKYPHLFK